ncbi:efflux transporter periplasmic adaptor subunit [Christiangramia fulva]|uniref:Efflux transporter periplasmic adaptor subunit n=1 Tax=Christiangramia fulva TaxID=2126553 RepID=A0A2R3Z7K1_9FLAO|nr:efflux RND transporter periplasmic adaptor subunit [Christiangramia fulva]AVR46257.1 efflux transporter periplasmic adaptor subunit [Christiangramia fulva]
MKTTIIHRLILSILGLMLASCANSEKKIVSEVEVKSDIQVTENQFKGNDMRLGQIQEKDFPQMVESTGIIDVPPENKAIISPYMEGYVKDTPLLIGDKVERGQFLVSLENPDYVQLQQDYLDALEQLQFLKSEYERQKTLAEEKITSQKNFLKAESDYKRNLSRYNALKKKLQMLNIDPSNVEKGNITSTVNLYAPISGSITEMMISKGMHVSAADKLMQITDINHLHLELNVFEKDVMKLKAGQDILVNIPEATEDTLAAEIHLIGKSIDEDKRTVRVHGHFKDEENNNFAAGMFVDAQIVIGSQKAMAIPSESVVSLDDKNYVLVLNSKEKNIYYLDRREVLTGDSYKGYTLIKNAADFKNGDQLLVKGAFPLITAE